MHRPVRCAAAGALMTLLLCAARDLSAQEPGLTAYRYWRDGGQTLVETYVTVPWALLTFADTAASEKARYEARVLVRDSAGTPLMRNVWQDSVVTVPLTADSRNRTSSTHRFAFTVPAGRYTASLEVRDLATGRSATVQLPIEGFAAAPPVSDLVVAAALENLRESGREAGATALVRGDLSITPNLEGVVTTERTRIAVLAELYRPGSTVAESANVVVRLDGDGQERFRTPPLRRVFRGGGVDAIPVDLAGLPVGDYTLSAEWIIAGDTVRARHPLRMLLPPAGEATLAIETLYEGLTEAQLDSVVAPMHFIMDAADEVGYEVLEGADAKRRYLAHFWLQRARLLGGTPQMLREEWEKRINFVNLAYAPPRIGKQQRLGWETDRGRVYLTYGPPATRMDDQDRDLGRNPWEAWKYTSGRGDKYLFWDRSGFGDYELVFTTNPVEPVMPVDQQSAAQVIQMLLRW